MIKLFISYAHEDEKFKDELEKHLKPLQRNGVVESWNDRKILPGKEWDDSIKIEIENADIILFLISPDFIASDYIHDTEIKNALDRYAKKEVIIIPVIIRPTDFSYLEISKFQALPKDGKPITTWSNVDEAWHNVVIQLRRVFESLGNVQKKPATTSNSGSSKNQDQQATSAVKSQIMNLVAQSKLEKAIKIMIDFATAANNNSLENRAILLSANLKNLENNEILNLISNSDASIQRAQITNSILKLKDEI